MNNQECNWYDVGCWLGWLVNEIKLIFVWITEQILSGVASVFEAIPMPEFLQYTLSTITLPSTMLWMIDLLNIQFGFYMVSGAYLSRFILRRLPFIG